MEQLPTLRLWRTRPGSSQRDPKSGASNPQNLLIPSASRPTRETATGGASSAQWWRCCTAVEVREQSRQYSVDELKQRIPPVARASAPSTRRFGTFVILPSRIR